MPGSSPFHAIADPTRRRILDALLAGPCEPANWRSAFRASAALPSASICACCAAASWYLQSSAAARSGIT